jgi:uncharacterized protein (DUF2384 family)
MAAFNPNLSVRLDQLARIEKKVKEVFVREDLVGEWWNTPLEDLGLKSPHDAWITGGFDLVEKVANRL